MSPRFLHLPRSPSRLLPLFTVAALHAATPSTPPPLKETPVALSAFEVTANADVGYESSTAMSGTRTNESLANLPNSISVFNTEFLSDLGITDFFQAADFAVGADNIYNDNLQVGAPVGARSGNQINFRGLPSVRQLKDGFPTYLPQDTYNTERIEISRGPGGIAYGDTDATGVINLTSKRGQFRNLTDFATRLDDRGSRASRSISTACSSIRRSPRASTGSIPASRAGTKTAGATSAPAPPRSAGNPSRPTAP